MDVIFRVAWVVEIDHKFYIVNICKKGVSVKIIQNSWFM